MHSSVKFQSANTNDSSADSPSFTGQTYEKKKLHAFGPNSDLMPISADLVYVSSISNCQVQVLENSPDNTAGNKLINRTNTQVSHSFTTFQNHTTRPQI